MKPEKRSHRRLKPKNITADVFSTQPSANELSLSAEIIDISQRFEQVLPCIDFAHWYSRSLGKENGKAVIFYEKEL